MNSEYAGENTSIPGLTSLLQAYRSVGGVVDFVFLLPNDEESIESRHRAAALAGMREMDRGLEQWALDLATDDESPKSFFRLRWDETKLKGKPISLPEFWGSDDVKMKPLGMEAWSVPEVDGYNTAFFLPPYGLRGSNREHEDLFTIINRFVLGPRPEEAEIFSWSTDWSNYFDAGNEWWGSFYWTVQPVDSPYIVAIGASTTD